MSSSQEGESFWKGLLSNAYNKIFLSLSRETYEECSIPKYEFNIYASVMYVQYFTVVLFTTVLHVDSTVGGKEQGIKNLFYQLLI